MTCKHEFEEIDSRGINTATRYKLDELDGKKQATFKCKKCGKTEQIEIKTSNRMNERDLDREGHT